MKTKRIQFRSGLLVIFALGVVIFISACGGSGSPAKPVPLPQSKTTTPPAAVSVPLPSAVAGGDIPVTLKDNKFPEEIRVKVGAKVVFVITNLGSTSHTFEAPDLGLYKEIKQDETMRFEWTVPDKKGSWDVGCFLTSPAGPHDGMEGVLIIE